MALKLELEVDEVNLVLRSLGKHPFDEIANLINKIKEQGEKQLLEQAAAQPEPETPAPETPVAE
jgi:hypothetical protein